MLLTHRLFATTALLLGLMPFAARAQMSQAAPSMMPTTPPVSATGARPGNDIGTGESLPRSPYVSNVVPSDTKSTIAPTPPAPNVPPDANVQQLLTASQASLAAGQTGTAEAALEQAETNILTRSVPQTQTDYTSQNPVVARIDQARQALGDGDKSGSMRIISQILASNAPELTD